MRQRAGRLSSAVGWTEHGVGWRLFVPDLDLDLDPANARKLEQREGSLSRRRRLHQLRQSPRRKKKIEKKDKRSVGLNGSMWASKLCSCA